MRILCMDGFEKGFFDWQDIPELTIPNDWGLDWDEDPEKRPGILVRPEYDEKFKTPEVRSGHSSVAIHTRDATHRTVLFKQFEAEPGALHRASVWAMGVTGPKGSSGHGMQVGIDPTGRLDFRAPSVVWGEWYSQYMKTWEDRKWVQISAVARAENDTITVFLRSQNDYKRDAFGHFDDFLLEVEGDDDTPSPEPGGECGFVDRWDEVLAKLDQIDAKLNGLLAS
ncbi:MAG: hypothetical protein JXA14_22825 [Anaerolineae bacterium]|nr:hypothetical protein [Anaerolineae bacterium]